MQKPHKPKDWRWLLHRALSLVFSRTVVTIVLVLAQAFWLFSLFYWLGDYSRILSRMGLGLSALMCLALVRQDSTAPEFKISWMILFMLMPVQGGLLYLLWGDKRPAIGLRRRMERAEAELAPLRTGDAAARAELQRRDPRLAETADYLQNHAAAPVFGGTAVRYYPVGDVMLPDMLADLRAAWSVPKPSLPRCAPGTPPRVPSCSAATRVWLRLPITCKTTLPRRFLAELPSDIIPWAT